MKRLIALGLLCLACTAHAADGTPPEPGPELTPRKVVEIQLEALQNNDEPHENAGIERVWAFAHPKNRRMTGPLERFSTMIRSPAYRPLLNHLGHRVDRIRLREDEAAFEVTVTAKSGKVVAYLWQLERVTEGALTGSWMTTSVSPPVDRGEMI